METDVGGSASGLHVISDDDLYTSDILKSIRTELAIFADDIFIYDQNKSPCNVISSR